MRKLITLAMVLFGALAASAAPLLAKTAGCCPPGCPLCR